MKKSTSALLNLKIEDSPSSIKAGGRFAEIQRKFRARSFFHSLSFAYEGLIYATQTQRNFRIHLVMAAFSISAGAFFHLAIIEWAILWGIIGIVLFAELVNTAIELFVDLLTDGNYDPRAKAIKDMTAGAVLVTALSALICGICIFTPHILDAFGIMF